ncbi:MAG: acetyl-CoA C-acyltransferase FadI [Sandaracinaceae bacterium]|nr:acetyl-CoA C-acyltransferase FadI [Sandaracinaceae bacterium]
MGKKNGKGRVAIVAGLRTPFAKQGSAYRSVSALELGTAVVGELLDRAGVPAKDIEQCVYGQVVPSLSAPNIAREIVLLAGLPASVEAFSVSRACATSYQSTVSVAQAIEAGAITCGIAGGADSASDVPISVSKKLAGALIAANSAKSLKGRLAAFAGLGPKDLLPVPPALKEFTTGLTMGESAEAMAKDFGITRAAQDELAHASHVNAAAAWADGRFDDEVMEVWVAPKYESIRKDNLVRMESSRESYDKLRPAFDKRHGTITAGNASPLTDGASALILMSEEKAKADGLSPLGYLRSYAFAALDPSEHMLMGPSYATPKALDRAGITLADLDLIDMHEAFAAQVLSNLAAFASTKFAKDKLGRAAPLGEVDRDKLNVTGGSIAIGHPFAATGARQITQTLRELRRRGGELALSTACAAGGLGAAIVLEAA